MSTGILTIRAPDSAADLDRVATEAREKAVLDLIRRGLVSTGRAARLLGMAKHDFLVWASGHGISPFDDTLTVEQLREEAARIRKALRPPGDVRAGGSRGSGASGKSTAVCV